MVTRTTHLPEDGDMLHRSSSTLFHLGVDARPSRNKLKRRPRQAEVRHYKCPQQCRSTTHNEHMGCSVVPSTGFGVASHRIVLSVAALGILQQCNVGSGSGASPRGEVKEAHVSIPCGRDMPACHPTLRAKPLGLTRYRSRLERHDARHRVVDPSVCT